MNFRHGIRQILTAASQTINLCCNPFSENTLAHETLSARCGRLGDTKPYALWKSAIDMLAKPFDGPDHCARAYQKAQARYTKQP